MSRVIEFFRAFLLEIQKALPGHQMKPVPFDHPIYHCFFVFIYCAPWFKGVRHRDMGLADGLHQGMAMTIEHPTRLGQAELAGRAVQ